MGIESEDAGSHQEREDRGSEVLFRLVFIVPRHLVQLQGTCLCLGPGIFSSGCSIYVKSNAAALVIVSSFMQLLKDSHRGLFAVEQLRCSTYVLEVSVSVEPSAGLVCVSLEP